MIDNIKKHIRALKALGVPTDHWDVILIYIINTKLDPESKRLWDMTLKKNELPKFEEFEQFLESRCFTLSNSSEIKPRDHTNSNKNKGVSSFITTDSKKQTTCAICAKSQHPAFKCPDLLSLSPQDRFKLVKRKELCLKCFRKGHSLNNCKFYNCKTCCQPHNVLLHFGLESEKESEVPDEKVVNPTIATHTKEINSHVLLETVMIKILSANGEYEIGRALIDPGSTSSFISRAIADKLCLKKTKSNFEINGIGSVKTNSLFKVACSISSLRDKYSHQIECLILNKITDPLPHTSFDISNWHFLNSYNLADPSFNCPGKIDILLGAKHCNEYSLNETYIPGQGLPSLRNTVFGWVVSGGIDSKYLNNKIKRVYSNLSTIELSEQLRKFWEIENITTSSEPIDNICEKLFTDSLTRLSNGKFQVKLPFDTANDSRKLGFSHYTAQKRLIQMERRRLLNSEFNTLYINFMKEYETLGHMERVPVDELTLPINRSFYLPHHAVLKTSSQTTKLRVVFDGSAKSSSGQSLNDLLLCGPTLQDDIFTHLCRLRFYPIVLLADVEKMYRQVFIDPEHRNFLKILWRDSPDEPIVEYRLTTVTYGTKPASFLAIRALKQLAIDNAEKFPIASHVISRDFYVDNLMTGVNTLEQGSMLLNELMTITSSIFPLRQWASNRSELVSNLPSCLKDQSVSFYSDKDDTINTLGLQWSPKSDLFHFYPNLVKGNITKRSLVSRVSRIFDPLGLISPILIPAKIFLQSLWLHKVAWDEGLSPHLANDWSVIEENIQSAKIVEIPRPVSDNLDNKHFLFGFCDASKAAYAAVLYIGSKTNNGELITKLLCSKTKVAPLKQLTIPRLELCGALLLSKLIRKVYKILLVKIESVNLWCDSQIVLHWLCSANNKQPVFVANRVNQIHEALADIEHFWHYIESKSNPADFASRGCTSVKLVKNQLWWDGPELLKDPDSWKLPFSKNLEVEPICAIHASVTTINELDFIKRQSSFTKTLKIIVWCHRFKLISRVSKFSEFITADEYKKALNALIRLHQNAYFSDEMSALNGNNNLPMKSKIKGLNPFIDPTGLLRVGGRISQSELPFDSCHPLILERHDNFTDMLIDYEHKRKCHANIQLLRSIIGKRFWIIGARSAIKARIYKCLICIRLRSSTTSQLMGELPSSRITPARPFLRTGVDYAGPFILKSAKGRTNKTTKAYVSLFVCFTTRLLILSVAFKKKRIKKNYNQKQIFIIFTTKKYFFAKRARAVVHSKHCSHLLKRKKIF